MSAFEVVGPASAGGASLSVAVLTDSKASGTNGGTATTGSWQTCVINTEVSDPSGIVSIASNQFTLANAGTYKIKAARTFYTTGRSRVKVRNVTDGADVGPIGLSTFFTDGGNDSGMTETEVVVTIAGSKAFEIQYRCSNGGGSDLELGVSSNWGDAETYLIVTIEKVA